MDEMETMAVGWRRKNGGRGREGREGGQSPRAKYEVSQRLTCLEAQPPHHHTQDTGGGQKDTCDTTQPGCQCNAMVDFASFPQLHLQSQEGEKVIIGGISGLPSVHTVQKLYISYVYYHCKVLDR